MEQEIEYVIYCRKSTDEHSGRQTQSIPDQIKFCIEYAKNNWLKIKQKDKDYDTIFENENEIRREDMEWDIENRRIYQNTRWLFIIKEQQSAKTPGRPKWKKLIKLIEKGTIKWLISYSPDRQARNLMEWWQIINLAEKWLVNLKYTNFFFENNASGRMMLWIWFVFAEHYSANLWERVKMANKSLVEEWYWMSVFKHWYMLNEAWYHIPHPKFFELWQQAFQMKLNNKTDKYISEWLIKNWYQKEHRGKESIFNWKNLYTVWRDPFYYWLFKHWDNQVNLVDNWYFEPLISEDDYINLMEMYWWSKHFFKTPWIKNKDNLDIMPIEENLIKTQDWYSLSFNIPNRKRFIKKLEEQKDKNPDMTLSDIIKPNQIRFDCKNINSKFYNLSITFEKIETEVINFLKNIKINEKIYKEYKKAMEIKINKKQQEINDELKKLRFEYNQILWKKNKYIFKNSDMKMDIDEEKVYNNQKSNYDRMLKIIKQKMDALETSERNKIIEFEIFSGILNNAYKYYNKGDYVRKKNFLKILFSNIIITADKQVIISVSNIFKPLFHEALGC